MRCQRVARFVFAEQPIDCSVQTGTQLLDRNEVVLLLDLGRLGPPGLAESWLSTLVVTRRWRSLASDVKKRTTAGMMGIDDRTGATSRSRALRYTRGAAALEASGIEL